MKRILLLCMLVLLLTGCKAQETFETVEDTTPVLTVTAPMQFFVALPDDASVPTFQDEGGQELYVCQGYTLSKQISESGDLEQTVQNLSGKSVEELEILKTRRDGCDRYEFVWTAAGEDGLQIGRACILDDGNYHYSLSALAQEDAAEKLRETFQEMFASCSLLDPDINLDTAS